MLWREKSHHELAPKSQGLLDEWLTKATHEALSGQRDSAAGIFNEILAETADYPADRIRVYLQAAGVLYGASSNLGELNAACETICKAWELIGVMNGHPKAQELSELVVSAYHRAAARRDGVLASMEDTLDYLPVIKVGDDAPTIEIPLPPHLADQPIRDDTELEVGAWPV